MKSKEAAGQGERRGSGEVGLDAFERRVSDGRVLD